MLELFGPQAIPAGQLTAADFTAAAKVLGCEEAAIRAVAAVETAGKPFDAQGRPQILFERHLFHRLTGGIYDAAHPEISNAVPGGYGDLSQQYPKLQTAAGLGAAGTSESPALRATSWGMFQILGLNCAAAGFANVVSFVTAMRTGDSAQLKAFVNFIRANPHLRQAIAQKDWPAFALGYNGRAEAQHDYDVRLAAAYAKARPTS